MACVHNQAKINQIKQEIKSLQTDLTNLRGNVTKATDIKQKHSEFNSKLQCVMTNLSGNYVEAGKSYDSGKMLKCSGDAMKTINECDTVITESNNKITTIQNTIRNLNRQILSLNGNCELCATPSSSSSSGSTT